jgi:branched-chain amino acid transport system substrate-binding protein
MQKIADYAIFPKGGTMKRIHMIRASLAAMTMLVTGAVFGADAKEIRIGVAGPHTGASAAFGEQLWRGAELAADDINKAGGINGMKVKLIKADDACEPKQAVSVANRLVDSDKVTAVVGHFCSASTIPASEVYSEANILMITPASTNPTVTDRNLPTVMRACGRDDQQGVVAAEFIVKNIKAKKVVVLHDKDTYGRGLADAMKLHMKSLGVTEVLYEGLTRGEKDFNALVTKIKAVNADAVYFGGLHTEAGPLIRQMREQGLTAAFVSGDGIVSNDFVTTAGGNKFVSGVYMTFGADARNLPEGKKVVEAFRKQKYEPEGYTLYSYATVQAIAAAIKGSGKTDGPSLAKWLKTNTVETVMGKKAWDDKGDLKISDFVMYKWSDNGKYDVVNKM